MARVYLQVDEVQLARRQADLAQIKGGIAQAAASAVNDALAGVKTAMSVEARKVYNVKAGRIRTSQRVVKASASGNVLSGSVISTGRAISYISFGARPSTNEPYLKGGKRPKMGVSVLIRRAVGRETLPRSFVVGRGGKFVVFQREAGTRGHNKGELDVPRGPSIPSMIEEPAVFDQITSQANPRLAGRLDHHVKRILEKSALRRAA